MERGRFPDSLEVGWDVYQTVELVTLAPGSDALLVDNGINACGSALCAACNSFDALTRREGTSASKDFSVRR